MCEPIQEKEQYTIRTIAITELEKVPKRTLVKRYGDTMYVPESCSRSHIDDSTSSNNRGPDGVYCERIRNSMGNTGIVKDYSNDQRCMSSRRTYHPSNLENNVDLVDKQTVNPERYFNYSSEVSDTIQSSAKHLSRGHDRAHCNTHTGLEHQAHRMYSDSKRNVSKIYTTGVDARENIDNKYITASNIHNTKRNVDKIEIPDDSFRNIGKVNKQEKSDHFRLKELTRNSKNPHMLQVIENPTSDMEELEESSHIPYATEHYRAQDATDVDGERYKYNYHDIKEQRSIPNAGRTGVLPLLSSDGHSRTKLPPSPPKYGHFKEWEPNKLSTFYENCPKRHSNQHNLSQMSEQSSELSIKQVNADQRGYTSHYPQIVNKGYHETQHDDLIFQFPDPIEYRRHHSPDRSSCQYAPRIVDPKDTDRSKLCNNTSGQIVVDVPPKQEDSTAISNIKPYEQKTKPIGRSVSIMEPVKERTVAREGSGKRVWLDVGEMTFKRIARQLSYSKKVDYMEPPEDPSLGPKPKSYFDLSIFTCCCCLSPFGFVAVILSGEYTFMTILYNLLGSQFKVDKNKNKNKL